LADDQPEILKSIQGLLEPAFEGVGSVADGESLFEGGMKLHPDVIVTDISMPKLSGTQAVQRLRKSGCASEVIFLTASEDPEIKEAALKTGALGYVLKHSIATDLLFAIDEVLAGRTFSSL
jgi:DNA-binding NarL/FixJ family response regulator